MGEELRKLLSEWQEELDGREVRIAVFRRKDDEWNYQLEYARISVLRRCISALSDMLNAAPPAEHDSEEGGE